MLTVTHLEPRDATVAFDLVFSPDSWFTADRRSVIGAAFGQWGRLVADSLTPIARTDYTVYDNRGLVLDDSPVPVPADVLRVYVRSGPTVNVGALAEAGPVGYSSSIDLLSRSPGGLVTFDPSKVTDALLSAVSLHEAGHVVGLGHQPADTPAEWHGVMHPRADAAKTTLTGLEARDLVWAGHEVTAGTVLTGIGTTPGGWMIYNPPA